MSLDVQKFFEERTLLRHDFLERHIYGDFSIEPVGEDWASRRYLRVFKDDGSTLVLLESVPDHIQTVTLGHKLRDYIRVSEHLHANGIGVPEIYAADEAEGFVLIEDFGSLSLYDALEKGGDPQELYGAATDILTHMRDVLGENTLGLPPFFEGYIYQRKRRMIDWYLPATRSEKNPDGLVEAYLDVWDKIEKSLPPCPTGFMHGDYHAQNLMILPDGRVGVLDFQDAYWGPLPFDLANLIEDIRRDIPRDVHAAMLEQYGADENFRAWFRVMATQFHCSIIGQVLRLAIVGGKLHLLKFIPRMQNYIREALKDPVLKPLADFVAAESIDLDAQGVFDPEKVRPFIRDDAF